MSPARITQRQPFYAIQDSLNGLCFSTRPNKPTWRPRTLATWFPSMAAAQSCLIERQVVGCIEIVRFDA